MAAHDTRERPMRRDAVRNQQLVIEAARDVVSEFGTDASMELIASRAGVGVGTVYRRFPNKEALVDEIVGLMLSELVVEARRALTLDDGTGLEVFLRVLGHSLSTHRGYAVKAVGRSKADCVEQLRDLIDELLGQAQRHGRIGPDIRLGDVMAVAWAVRGIVETTGSVAPDAWQRHLDIHLAGLRAAAPQSARVPVSREQLTLITGVAHPDRAPGERPAVR
ncbi:helix-turn-helix domain-containing protein [Streptomyces sp. NPDC051976]|uniref:TetR/AcrR family transcriptional regulator n=1 Tax=Streptomyces sp. NPDC051976 TaxID=3154947 RepID=UPI00342ADB47